MFKRNALDIIDDDIHDVADREILKEMVNGQLIIYTVQDYCNHMVRCYQRKPDDVKHALGIR